jgi:glyoxylase-like metal-dependent hydrolase (beta-lactamase superfamily II)
MVDTKSDDGLVLIDVGLNFEPIRGIENEGFDIKNIKHCLITHGHIDHFGACYILKEINKDIKFYAHELDVKDNELKITAPDVAEIYADYKYEAIKIDKKIKSDGEALKFGILEFKCIHIPGHTPGSVAYFLETGGKRILFAGDLPGIAINVQGGSLDDYLKSMQKLLGLNIDILLEGHEDIIQPAEKVVKFIEAYMVLNKNLNTLILEDPLNCDALLDLASITYELGFYENTVDFCNYALEIDPDNSEAQEFLSKAKEHNPPKLEWIKNFVNQYRKS